MKVSMWALSWLSELKEAPLSALFGQDREPDLDLVEPRGTGRREVEAHVGMAREPTVVLRLVGVEIVEDDMDLAARMGGNDAVHEVEELDPSPASVLPARHLAGGDVEGGEQGRRAVPRIVVRLAGGGAAVRQLEKALGALQRLDRRLLVDRQNQRTLGPVDVEPDHRVGLGRELVIFALGP